MQTTAAITSDPGKAGDQQRNGGHGSNTTNQNKTSRKDGKTKHIVAPEFMVNEDLTVNGSIFFTTGFPRDLAMLNNTGAVRIYSAYGAQASAAALACKARATAV